MNVTLRPLVDRWVQIRNRKRDLKEEEKELNQEQELLGIRISQLMAIGGFDSIVLAGHRVTPGVKMRARILGEASAEAVQHVADESGLRLTINANSLSAWVNERRENKEPIPPGIDVYEQPTLYVSKQ